MPVIDIQKLEDKEKAAWFSGFMYYECMKIIYNIIDECETFEDFGIIVEKKKIKHIDIAKKVVHAVTNSEFFKQEDKNAITVFEPVIQSAGFYNLDLNCSSDENYFRDDVIILHLSISYNEYYSTIIRTIMVTPTSNQSLKKKYKSLIRIQKFVINKLRDGVKLSKIYQDTFDFVQKKKPELIQYLNDNFGSIAKIPPQNENHAIKANSREIAQENMIFNVNIGLHSIYDDKLMERPPHTYSLWIGDCVKVEKGKRATLLKHNLYKVNFVLLRQPRKINSSE